MGTILLQHLEEKDDVGDQDLLAVKLALEQRKHWLVGATHPFMIYMNNKNLEYLWMMPLTLLLTYQSPAPLEVNGRLAYRVSNILNPCRRASWQEYLVEGEGYGPEFSSASAFSRSR